MPREAGRTIVRWAAAPGTIVAGFLGAPPDFAQDVDAHRQDRYSLSRSAQGRLAWGGQGMIDQRTAPYAALLLRLTLGGLFIAHLFWKFAILEGGLDRWWSNGHYYHLNLIKGEHDSSPILLN